MTPSLEGWPTKAKEASSPHEVRLAPLDANPEFLCLGELATYLLNLLAWLTLTVFQKNMIFQQTKENSSVR